MGSDDFACPFCGAQHDHDDWWDKYDRLQNKGIFELTMNCRSCKRKICVSPNMMGQAVAYAPA